MSRAIPAARGPRPVALVPALVLALALGAACSGGHHDGARGAGSPRSVRAVPALDHDALGRVADTWLRRHHAAGVVVGVQIGSHAPVLAARGGVPADARVDIGRVAAAFVAAAAVRLADAGRLDLDATIDRWVPAFPHASAITVRDLLTHRSGIPPFAGESGAPNPYTAASRAFLARRGRAPSAAEVVAFVARRRLRSRPGTAVLYSDVNTVLAGMVVAGVTHTGLARALAAEVLDPWRLAATRPAVTAGGAGSPAGSLVSTARDLLAFTAGYLRPALRGEHDLARSALAVGPGGTGLGVEGFTADGFCVFASHGCPRGAPFVAVGAGSGARGGGAAMLAYDPLDDVAVVAVAPRGAGGAAGPDLADLVARARLLAQLGAARYDASVGYSARVPSTAAAR